MEVEPGEKLRVGVFLARPGCFGASAASEGLPRYWRSCKLLRLQTLTVSAREGPEMRSALQRSGCKLSKHVS